MSTSGVSVLLQATNDIAGARRFLQQFIEVNTFRPIEVIVLFECPGAEHLKISSEFANRLKVIVRPSKGRSFSRLLTQLNYDQVLILQTSESWEGDWLSGLAEQLLKTTETVIRLEKSQALFLDIKSAKFLQDQPLHTDFDTLLRVLLKSCVAEIRHSPSVSDFSGQKSPPFNRKEKPTGHSQIKSELPKEGKPSKAPLEPTTKIKDSSKEGGHSSSAARGESKPKVTRETVAKAATTGAMSGANKTATQNAQKSQDQVPKSPQKPAESDPTKKKTQQDDKAAVAREHAKLDQQIEIMTNELTELDDDLTRQYSEIEVLDQQYEAKCQADAKWKESDEGKALREDLKARVYKSNDTLKSLKDKHDELERLRIRRYSILT